MMKLLKNSQGFSLMELMIAMAIFSIVIAAIISSKSEQQGQQSTQIQAVEMQQSVRAVMFLMKRDIRIAGFNPLSKDDYDAGITTATATTFAFTFVNIDDIPPIVDPATTYTLTDDDGDGDNDITLDGTVLAENIQALTFRYFDGTSPTALELVPPIATPGDIRSIQITITARVDNNQLAGTSNNNTRTLSSTVSLRNMGL